MSKFEKDFCSLLDTIPLAKSQKEIIKSRYVNIITDAETDYNRICFVYFTLTNLITIAGVFVTALISLEKISNISETGKSIIFWIVWSMSISLTLANKWLYSYSIDKKYVLGIAFLEKLYSEGWSFLAGIGIYQNDNYDARYNLFCSRVEKLKTKSLETIPEMESNETASGLLAAGPKNVSKNDESTSTKSKNVVGNIKNTDTTQKQLSKNSNIMGKNDDNLINSYSDEYSSDNIVAKSSSGDTVINMKT